MKASDYVRPAAPTAEVDVSHIQRAVQLDGDEALRFFSKQFDQFEGPLEVAEGAAKAAWDQLDDQTKEDLQLAANRIRAFHEAQLPEPLEMELDGVTLGRRFLPVARAGCYIPGGRANYPSTALMCVIAAKVAGVNEVIACCPPGPDGIPPLTLAALHLAGADRVFQVGGAHAIFAMAYGSETVPAVQRIVGPGNAYVTKAKEMVAGAVPIDAPAGPSEILVLADETANPQTIALDVLAQAEHDPDALCVVLATSESLLQNVQQILGEGDPSKVQIQSLQHAAFLYAEADELAQFSNQFAPEHVSLQVADPDALLAKLHSYGSAFLGPHSAVAFGDYISGTNHVLPTMNMAHAYGALGVDTFLRAATHQTVTENGAKTLGPAAARLADLEGLHAHAASMRGRP